MDRKSALDADDKDISLRVDPSDQRRASNTWGRALQEQERRRQVAAGRRRGGASTTDSFDAFSANPTSRSVMAQGGELGAGARSGGPDMMMSLPSGQKAEGDDVAGWSDVTSGSVGGMVQRRDHAKPRQATNIQVENFSWFTCNLANLHQGPSCPRPAVRWTGLFHSKEEAEGHIEEESQHEDIGGLGILSFAFRTKHLVLCGITPERARDKDVIDRKKPHFFDAHYGWAEERMKKFEENKNHHHHGEVGASSRHKREVKKKQNQLREKVPVPEDVQKAREAQLQEFLKFMAEKNEAEKAQGKKAFNPEAGPPAYPKELEQRGQNWIAATVVQDETVTVDEGPHGWEDAEAAGFEPMFITHTSARTPEEIDQIAENVVWNKYLDADTLPAPMYEWLYLDDVDNPRIKNNWYDAEQDLVMKRQEKDIAEAIKFADLCDSVDKKVPIIDITKEGGTGMIPAMRKGELEGEELEKTVKEQEEFKKREEVILKGSMEEARKIQKEDEMMNRPTFIRADGTVDEKSKRRREPPLE